MKISVNRLFQFINPTQSVEEICELLTSSGLEVESVEPIESVKGGLKGLLIGQVLTKDKHPNADKLSITTVEVGQENPLNIVCGAQNVAVGQKVVVAPVGCTIYPTQGEPFTLGKAKIRGEASEGMICAEDEIGIGTSHEGILVLTEDAPVGENFASYYSIYTDTLIEIGLTANRGDAASHLGVAREISALINSPLIKPVFPPIYSNLACPFSVGIANAEACPRYSGVYVQGVNASESPSWLKNFLLTIGLGSKNLLVDLGNYIMHSIGQPMHVFDADKLEGNLEIKQAIKGQKFTCLDGTEIELTGEELMVWDSKKPVAIAGVMGGQNSAVDSNTKNIFLESAYFDPAMVRKSAKSHALNTDASFRFERGTNPLDTTWALQMFLTLLQENSKPEAYSQVFDVQSKVLAPFEITLHKSELKRICGIEIPAAKVDEILNNLEIHVVSKSDTEWQLLVPVFKSDVTREIDVIEELIRIYGFENIPLKKDMHFALPKPGVGIDKQLASKYKISSFLRALGFNEMQNNSMTKKRYVEENDNTVVYVKNPLSQDMAIMRTSMLHGALESVAYNQKRKADSILLFEFGKTYQKKESGAFAETEKIVLAASGNLQAESWENKNQKAEYFFMKNILQGLAKLLGIEEISEKNGLLFLGQAPDELLKATDAKNPTVLAEINWNKLYKSTLKQDFKIKDIPKFPIVRRDLSLVIDKAVSFESIFKLAKQIEKKQLKNIFTFDVFEGEPLEANQKAYSLAFELYNEEQTMDEKQIESIMNKLMLAFEKQLGAKIRK
jgi:phenylalanyl-tRNA synthetase beta chain